MCFNCSQRGTLQSGMNFMWGRIWNFNLMHVFFPDPALLSKRPQGREAMYASCQHAYLSPFLSLQPVWNVESASFHHSYIELEQNWINCWFLPAKFIDLSLCTGHLMLGFFEPTYRHRMAQGRYWTGPLSILCFSQVMLLCHNVPWPHDSWRSNVTCFFLILFEWQIPPGICATSAVWGKTSLATTFGWWQPMPYCAGWR